MAQEEPRRSTAGHHKKDRGRTTTNGTSDGSPSQTVQSGTDPVPNRNSDTFMAQRVVRNEGD